MTRAAEAIGALGGAESTNSFTRFYLALLGQLPYSACPSVPAELMLLPKWFFFNIYAMSAWSRTIFVPLAVVDAHKPVTRLPESMHIRELFLESETAIAMMSGVPPGALGILPNDTMAETRDEVNTLANSERMLAQMLCEPTLPVSISEGGGFAPGAPRRSASRAASRFRSAVVASPVSLRPSARSKARTRSCQSAAP